MQDLFYYCGNIDFSKILLTSVSTLCSFLDTLVVLTGVVMVTLHDLMVTLGDFATCCIDKKGLRRAGLLKNDPRLKEAMTNIQKAQSLLSDIEGRDVFLERDVFKE